MPTRDHAWKVIAVLALVLAAFLGLHQPPREAHAQSFGGPGIYDAGSLWNVAPSTSTNLFASNLIPAGGRGPSPSQAASVYKIGFCPKVSGVLYMSETNGATTFVKAVGSSATLYQDNNFLVVVRSFDTAGNALSYNFQLGTNGGGIVYLRVQELVGGVD